MVQPTERRLVVEKTFLEKLAPLVASIAGLNQTTLQRGDLLAEDDLDNLNSNEKQGRWRIRSTATRNTPAAAIGYVDVFRNPGDARVTQIFTRSATGPLVQHSRVYSGTTWSLWHPFGWNRSLLANNSVDFDVVKDIGVHSVQGIAHPNQPVPVVGTLEVLPASGFFSQRFTTWEAVPREFIRRFTGAVWQGWNQSPTAPALGELFAKLERLENGQSGTAADFGTPTRAPLSAMPLTVASVRNNDLMTSMSIDRTRGWNWHASTLKETRDDGKTWATVATVGTPFGGSSIESVAQLANGELMVTAAFVTEGRRAVLVSEGYGRPGELKFTRTLTAPVPYVKFPPSWSQSTAGPVVLLAEYGPKTGADWAGNPVAAGENARHVYMSLDYGRTWETIFDLNRFLTTAHGHTHTDIQHLHGVAWDPYWDRIWLSWGDNMSGNGSNGIAYSDDLGATWKTAHYWSGQNAPHQVVGILPMPKCVLFFGDMGPDVVRIDRTEGKHTGTYKTATAWESTAPGKHLCQGFSRIARLGDDAPALAAFCAEGAAAPSFAVATMDGYSFTEIWRDPVNQTAGMGARSIIGPTLRGNVIITSDDQKVDGLRTEVRLPAPGY